MEELKPCPFCGEKARIDRYEYFYRVLCTDCPALTEWLYSEQEAIKDWNNRAERTCHNLSEFQDCDCFTCSNCGESYEMRRLEYDIDEYCTLDDAIKALDYDGCYCDVRYCPNCGAKVVQNA